MNPNEHDKHSGIIREFLKPFPQRETVKAFINLCQKIISAYLYRKENYKSYYINTFGIGVDDLSFDCIADMFKIDSEGKFVEFTEYFSKLEKEKPLDDLELLIQLRRLLFSKANNRLFRLNKEFDPSLGKIIRNIKLAIQSNPDLEIDTFYCQNVIVFKNFNWREDQLPVIPIEIFEIDFVSIVKVTENIKELLEKLKQYLETLKEYKKLVYIIDAAIIVRNAYSDKNLDRVQDSIEPTILAADIQKVIDAVVCAVNKDIIESYLANNKINHDTAVNYLHMIEELLADQYINGENGKSYFEYLKKYLLGLSQNDYMNDHRTKIEYITKQAKQRANELLKREIFSL